MKPMLWLLAGLTACASCGPGDSASSHLDRSTGTDSLRGRSVVLIVADSLHAEHLSCYGYERATTPHIDRLARTGLRFTQVYSQSSWTLPSVASLFTSLEQERHGLRHLTSSLPEQLSTLAECFAKRGYVTRAVLQNPLLSPATGLQRGFHSVARFDWSAQDAERAVDRAIEHLRHNSKGPQFLYVHLVPPHMPYQPPTPFRGRFSASVPPQAGSIEDCRRIHKAGLDPRHPDVKLLVDLYDEHVAYLDSLAGRLLAEIRAVPAPDRPLVVFTSDHGEAFMQHGSQGHNATVFDEMVRVPLLFCSPDLPAGVIDGAVSLLDLMPTLIDWLDLAPAGHALNGISLLPTMAGAPLPERDLFLSSRYKNDPAKLHLGLRRGTHKLVLTGNKSGLQLFDMASDPGENSDLKNQYPRLALELERRLLDWHSARVLSSVSATPPDDAALQALGYTED